MAENGYILIPKEEWEGGHISEHWQGPRQTKFQNDWRFIEPIQ